MQKRNDQEKIKKRLSNLYYKKEALEYDKIRTATTQLKEVFFRERKIIRRLIGKKRGKILDVACGTGRFFDLYRGMEIYGIDISEDMLNELKRKKIKAKLKICDAEKITFPDNMFDVTISTRFIRHIPQFLKVIKEMVRVTKPEGKIILEFPNKHSISYFFTERRIKTGKMVYYNFFTLKDIENIGKEFNLKIEKIEGTFLITPKIFPSFLLWISRCINRISFLLDRFGYVYYASFTKLRNSQNHF